MNLNDAFRKAIKAYWAGKKPEKLGKEIKGRMKYTKDYFDSFEKEEFGSIEGEME